MVSSVQIESSWGISIKGQALIFPTYHTETCMKGDRFMGVSTGWQSRSRARGVLVSKVNVGVHNHSTLSTRRRKHYPQRSKMLMTDSIEGFGRFSSISTRALRRLEI